MGPYGLAADQANILGVLSLIFWALVYASRKHDVMKERFLMPKHIRNRFIILILLILATFHDVLTVLGVFYLLDKEITLLVITALLTMCGTLLHDFALALLISVVVGTYSSIFVASPIVYIWENLRNKNRGEKN